LGIAGFRLKKRLGCKISVLARAFGELLWPLDMTR
jgi:hypothetical protein